MEAIAVSFDRSMELPVPSAVKARDPPGLLATLLRSTFAPASALAGIGPKNAKLFNRLLDKPQGARVVDILFHLPQATVDYMTAKIPMKRCGALDEAAKMIAWIVSPACSFTTGFTFDLSGGRATY